MSWGFHLKLEDGKMVEVVDSCTYNLTPMFELAGVFVMSRDIDGMMGYDLGKLALRGFIKAAQNQEEFEALNPKNGWGNFDIFMTDLIAMVRWTHKYPEGIVVWNG